MKFLAPVGCLAAFFISACDSVQPEETTILHYTSAKLSGLNPIRPFPNSDDVCLLLKENKLTSVIDNQGRSLIACPKHEKGVISDRLTEGARVVANLEHWVFRRTEGARVVANTEHWVLLSAHKNKVK
jgi:hypothetical protein